MALKVTWMEKFFEIIKTFLMPFEKGLRRHLGALPSCAKNEWVHDGNSIDFWHFGQFFELAV